MITIRAMRAAGMSAEQIVRLLESAENEKLLHRREQNRINKRNQRSRHQNRADGDDMMTSAYIEESLSSSSSTQSKKKERKKVSIPENWSPNEKGLGLARQVGFDDQKIKLEIHRFRDYAQQHNRQYADWQAAWRNWVTSPLQKGATDAGRVRKPTLVEIGEQLADEARELERRAGIVRSDDTFGSR